MDSLQQQLFLNERYITSIADALSGNVDLEDIPSSRTIDDMTSLRSWTLAQTNKTLFYVQKLHRKISLIYLKQLGLK